MKPRRLLQRLAQGAVHNVSFADFTALVESLGFSLERVEGSHHIFVHAVIREQINLQNVAGEAKPYQIRQVLRIVERQGLTLGEERDAR